ncbi:hypothetical protein RRG08_047808 [Elysia crispata]|uniref:Uncharacterized protein n=1 Tax=Elysia crispata TaxID=231223 RepID=A0AAE1CRN5_9GAST|nr:hypothetical protein RRG08_047808 [Elysia crispata]
MDATTRRRKMGFEAQLEYLPLGWEPNKNKNSYIGNDVGVFLQLPNPSQHVWLMRSRVGGAQFPLLPAQPRDSRANYCKHQHKCQAASPHFLSYTISLIGHARRTHRKLVRISYQIPRKSPRFIPHHVSVSC